MNPASSAVPAPPRSVRKVRSIGCVSYLNAKPLIDGLEDQADPSVRFDVPSRLLDGLEADETDIALCPVIDYYRSQVPLEVVPVGGISSIGETLTVRLYSRIPIDRIRRVHVDRDSHTSVVLLRVLLDQMHSLRPELVEYDACRDAAEHDVDSLPESMLLIGDKVIAAAPAAESYPHELDLGQGWYSLTGLPFVFAVWMARRGADLGDLPAVLDDRREQNLARIDAIADRHGPRHNWPRDLARRYLSRILSYTIGPTELEAIDRFAAAAHGLGLIDQRLPLHVRQ